MNPNTQPDRLKDFLDFKVDEYNRLSFIESDPISIPHRYNLKEDIEVSAFLAATIAWGNRKMIIRNGSRILEVMGESPYDFVLSHSEKDLSRFDGMVHRTFNTDDLKYFIQAMKHIYVNHGGFETVFTKYSTEFSTQNAISQFKQVFFELPHPKRSQKHVSDPLLGSAAKRLNMWLRWLVRSDNRGVDFGLWKSISPAALSCPLDVHSGNIARKLGLLCRSENDSKAVAELDSALRKFDPTDPVKYDFALFGLGVFEKF